MIAALILLGISIACYSVSQLQIQKKSRWMKATNSLSFWGENSWLRKYKNIHKEKGKFQVAIPLDNWYYNTFNIKYQEAWFTSTNFTVAFTDSYHALQSISFLSLSGCVSLLSGISFWYVWLGVLLCHFITYKLLSK